jgi:hypothetical protein
MLMIFKEVPAPDLHIPTRLEIAASTRPKQLVTTTLKQKEKEHAGQIYKPSKRDSAQIHNINWKSPTFWPMINKVAMEQVGKPNLSEIIRTLRGRDQRFQHLTHQRLSDWRDKTREDKIVWSEKTLLDVQKGFLPGGDQTRHNVFVSFLYSVCRSITNKI